MLTSTKKQCDHKLILSQLRANDAIDLSPRSRWRQTKGEIIASNNPRPTRIIKQDHTGDVFNRYDPSPFDYVLKNPATAREASQSPNILSLSSSLSSSRRSHQQP
jgi:hypothetical protein